MLLEVKNLSVTFGGLKAVNGFDLSIDGHELVGLIGPNGAGKTTVFNLLTGVYPPTTGSIKLNGLSIVNKSVSAIARSGVARTFQNIRLFKDMTVLENVLVALANKYDYSPLEAILRLPKYWKKEEEMAGAALELLEMFGLDKKADHKSSNLPYGEQRKLEIARALALSPKLLLLDEPAAGMNPSETKMLMETITFIKKKFDIAILLIEHDMNLVMNICEKINVLEYGTIIASGLPSEIKTDPKVIAAYLGE